VDGRVLVVTTPPAVELLPHLRAAKDLIDRHFAEPLDVAALADAACCSRYHFQRSFRAAYGVTPARYLTRRRIERATDLLGAVNLTVTEVCGLVGFASLGSFSTRFSELVGESPSSYQVRTLAAGGHPPVPGCFVLMAGGFRRTGGARPDRALSKKPTTAPTP
jgi:transcriptional regulator GlxA family with amidase domain